MEAHCRPSRAPAYRRDAPFAAAALAVLSATMFLAACDSADTTGGPGSPVSTSPIVSIDPPAARGAIAPDLSPAGAGLILTWVEPVAPAGHAVRMSRLSRNDGTWSWGSPTTVAVGEDFFVNWADFPSVREATDGSMIA
ncbi:MAG TPA: hypothetical protein VFP98_02530, partial [Candidatus Polarisedimenticolia bacterium]|nr:hypothetical protein [Candidatus Polarisedimenticolia bacterium]